MCTKLILSAKNLETKSEDALTELVAAQSVGRKYQIIWENIPKGSYELKVHCSVEIPETKEKVSDINERWAKLTAEQKQAIFKKGEEEKLPKLSNKLLKSLDQVFRNKEGSSLEVSEVIFKSGKIKSSGDSSGVSRAVFRDITDEKEAREIAPRRMKNVLQMLA